MTERTRDKDFKIELSSFNFRKTRDLGHEFILDTSLFVLGKNKIRTTNISHTTNLHLCPYTRIYDMQNLKGYILKSEQRDYQ